MRSPTPRATTAPGLKTVRKAKPASVNLSLAALDHFYRFLGLDPPDVAREDLPARSKIVVTV